MQKPICNYSHHTATATKKQKLNSEYYINLINTVNHLQVAIFLSL